MKDPADPAYGCAPARFVRAIRAVAPPAGMTGMRERDRRDRLRAAADPRLRAGRARRLVQAAGAGRHAARRWRSSTAKGRAFQTHTELDPGAPGRAPHLRRLPQPAPRRRAELGHVVNTMPAALQAGAGERSTSRARRWPRCATRLDADGAGARRRPGLHRRLGRHQPSPASPARASIALRYTGNANPADDLVTPAPVNGIDQLPGAHPAAVDARPGGANTCTNCHADTAKLDLRGTTCGHRPGSPTRNCARRPGARRPPGCR